MSEEKFYRNWVQDEELVSFEVRLKETDLFIRAERNLRDKAQRILGKYRQVIESYIEKNPLFLKSLQPIEVEEGAPKIVKEMVWASQRAGVGPMAAVAGAIAEYVGRELLGFSKEVIVENGGDIFMEVKKERVVAIYAGDSPFSGRIGLEIKPSMTPIGICTSSGKVGHSLSFGKADAVTILARSSALADAVATAVGNEVKSSEDIEKALRIAEEKGVIGAVVVVGDKVGFWGDIKICKL
jgi:hypothetical protein